MESNHSETQQCKWCKQPIGEYCFQSERCQRTCFRCSIPIGLCNSYGTNVGINYCEPCFGERMSSECKWHLLGSSGIGN